MPSLASSCKPLHIGDADGPDGLPASAVGRVSLCQKRDFQSETSQARLITFVIVEVCLPGRRIRSYDGVANPLSSNRGLRYRRKRARSVFFLPELTANVPLSLGT